jgi:glycosidase
MNKILIFIVVILGLYSCSNNENQKAVWEDFGDRANALHGLASPIELLTDTTIVLVSDYFPNKVEIDSVESSLTQVSSSLSDDQTQITLVKNGLTNSTIGNLRIIAGGIPFDILIKNQAQLTHTFTYTPKPDLANLDLDVAVKGTFNNWQLSPLSYNNQSRSFELTVPLKSGVYQYKYVVQGEELNDVNNPRIVSNGMGGTNSEIEVKGLDISLLPKITTHSFSEDTFVIKASNTNKLFAYLNNQLRVFEVYKDLCKIPLPATGFANRADFRVIGLNESGFSKDLQIPILNGKVVTDPSQLSNNDWHTSIMYFMMVDRFLDGNPKNTKPVNDPEILPKANYMGGDLAGITKKIKDGYFNNLGINTIWLSPINQNPYDAWGQFKDPNTKFSGYHGYWPITSTTIDTRFGTKAELNELLELAHAQGIRVLLDYVANHVHQDHPVYQQHKDWVTNLYLPDGTMNTERWDDHRLTTWFDTFMPSLDLQNQEVTDFMVDSALFWISEFDFDGFRHDATKHIPENFWRTLTQKVKKQSQKSGKNYYQIGETYGSNDLIKSYIGSGMIDGQFDFNLYDQSLKAFATPEVGFSKVIENVDASIESYGVNHLMGNISGNQDKPRFMSFADGSLSFDTPWQEFKRIGWKQTIPVKDTVGYRKMEMLNAFNMTIPGIPIIYYGDEIGMPGAGDPDNRRMMIFDSLDDHQENLKNAIKRLIDIREHNIALIYGDFSWLHKDDYLMAFKRNYFEQEAIVAFNTSDTQQIIHVNEKEYVVPAQSYKIWINE